ncbi:MAG TPA: efflux RND transporter periplasmic adaptor subunit [Gemmatimonadaceae bacterium]|nr:efflux RND transporter periplasmic adaptor subunit [Gemmatimonadaceae bacterium]
MLRTHSILRLPAVLLAVVVAIAACSSSAEQVDQLASTGTLVRTAAVKDTLLTRPIIASGVVRPKEEVALSFKISGVVDQIHVDPGDEVRKGQVLATLLLREVDASVTRAHSIVEKSSRDLARARRLYADSVVTLVQLQDAETAAQVARAELEAASFNRRYATIVARSSGRVLQRNAEPGETVAAGATILVVGSDARGSIIRVGLADRDAVRVRIGDTAIAHFDAYPERRFVGQVSQIDAAADAGTGTYAVEIAIEEADDVAVGLVGQVQLTPGATLPTSFVPIEALLEADGDEATVYALSADGKRAVRRRVTIAFIDDGRAAIARGLEGITTVLTDGAAYVDEGSALRIRP